MIIDTNNPSEFAMELEAAVKAGKITESDRAEIDRFAEYLRTKESSGCKTWGEWYDRFYGTPEK